MKLYLKNDVYEEAKARIRWLFDEFPVVVVNVSGGKDSTVVYNLVREVAIEKNRLPINVCFIDQEAEWEHTIKYVKTIMYDPLVKPYWLQVPIKIFNATSFEDDWLMCWKEGDEWIREKDPISIKVNTYGTDRFKELFTAFLKKEFPNDRVASISGVRTEESPGRHVGLTASLCWKDVTWGIMLDKGKHIGFYPIYDWSYTDVWAYIHKNKIPYNKIYDYQFRYGLDINSMRVSNLHHETAIRNLFYMQEVEPKTHEAITKRLRGIDSATKLGKADFWADKLPFMFKDWMEYREYLLDKLIKPENKKNFRSYFDRHDKEFSHLKEYQNILKVHVNSILSNDWTGTKLKNLSLAKSTPETRKIYHERCENDF